MGDPSEYGANYEVSKSESVKDWLSKTPGSIEGASNNLLDYLSTEQMIFKTNDVSQSADVYGTLKMSKSIQSSEISRNVLLVIVWKSRV